MKEALVAFIIALVVGSLINGYHPTAPDNSNQAGGGAAPSAGTNGPPTSYAGSGLQASDQTKSTPEIASVNESNFAAEVLNDKEPVLVDFTRDNCIHCRKMKPVLNELAKEHAGNLKVVQIDVMDNPAIANKYDINAVPAFLILDNGRADGPFLGEISKDQLETMIKPHLRLTARPGERASADG
jgi:thioredoxin 2